MIWDLVPGKDNIVFLFQNAQSFSLVQIASNSYVSGVRSQRIQWSKMNLTIHLDIMCFYCYFIYYCYYYVFLFLCMFYIFCFYCVVLCIVCVSICTVLLPPDISPIAVNKYDNIISISRDKTKNEWSYTTAPPICLHGVDRDSCTFTFIWDP